MKCMRLVAAVALLLMFFTQSQGASIAVEVREMMVIDYAIPDTSLGQKINASYMVAKDGASRVFIGADDQPYLLSRSDAKGSLLQLATGNAVITSDLLKGIATKSMVGTDEGWLVAIDYWAQKSDKRGLYRLSLAGKYSQYSLSEKYDGLGDIISAPDGGWLFCDFEKNNIYKVQKENEETPLLRKNIPQGLIRLVWNPQQKQLYAGSRKGSAAFAKTAGVYRVENATVVEVAQPEQLGGMAWSNGKLFPEGLYFSDTEQGTVNRIANKGIEIVIKDLNRPQDIRFDPRNGDLLLVGVNDSLIRFSRKAAPIYPGMQVLIPGRSQINGDPVPQAQVSIAGQTHIMDQHGQSTIDGIRPGMHKVQVVHHGYLKSEAKHEVAADKKLILGMQPVPRLSMQGKLLSEDGKALIGAEIRLRPIDSSAVPHGEVRLSSDIQGTFSVLHIPAGKYQISISLPGYQALEVSEDWLQSSKTLKYVLKSSRTKQESRQTEREPNNKPQQGQQLKLGETVSGKIDVLKDADWYRVHLSRPGQLVVSMEEHPEMQQQVSVFAADDPEKILANKGEYPNHPLLMTYWVASAGDYLLQVQEWGNNDSSKMPYIMKVDFIPDDGISDPSLDVFPPKAVRELSLHGLQGNTIWPLHDQDIYKINLPGSGLLRLVGKAPHQLNLKLFSDKGKLLGDKGGYPGNLVQLDHQASASGEVYLQVLEWGNNDASTHPYSIEADWYAADRNDFKHHNDTLASATPLRDGILTNGTILPLHDKDLYRLVVDFPGQLRVHAEATPGQRLIRILDAQGKVVSERGRYPNNSIDLSVPVLPGSWFVEVSEWGNNSLILPDYRVNTHLYRAEPAESIPLKDDPLRPMKADEGQSFYIDQIGDRDRFSFTVPASGTWVLNVVYPEQILVRVEKKGVDKPLFERGRYAYQQIAESFKLEKGDELLISLREWGDNDRSDEPGFVMMSGQPIVLFADRVHISSGAQPGEVVLSRTETKLNRPLKVMLDADGDGKADMELPKDKVATWKYAKPGLYKGSIWHSGRNNQVMTDGHWVKQGSAWNAPDTLSWRDKGRTFDLDFGKLATVADIEVQLDNNDSYEISYSVDGKAFKPLLKIPGNIGKVGWGMDRFSSLPGADYYQKGMRFKPVQAQYLRLQATAGDNAYAVAELQTLDKQGKVIPAMPVSKDYLIKQSIWIDARDQVESADLQLGLDGMDNNQLLEQPTPVVAYAKASVGANLKEVIFRLDGKPLSHLQQPPYKIDLPWDTLSEEKHVLEVEARDTRGKVKKLKRSFRLADYFGLQPQNGAEFTGTSRWISWTGNGYGAAKVFYREQGSKDWQMTEGEAGRKRRVLLRGLSSGKSYEYYVETASGKSPVRQFSLLKGLAFGQSNYGAVVKRDYDQRLGVSVKNNGDKALKVLLKCGKPDDPLLLAGFVGEGSQDEPFLLKPGEEKRFMLGISAQDVMTAKHRFTISMEADNGLSDEAEVSVWVRLPRIELEWKDLGMDKDGIAHLYQLKNKGDTVTDLSVQSEAGNDVSISPTVTHGMLRAGQSMRFKVRPRFYKGFRQVSTKLVAKTLDKQFIQNYQLKLKKGESAHQVWLFPGMVAEEENDPQLQRQLALNVEKAQALDPSRLDWSKKDQAQDVDGDGEMDRWVLTTEEVRWVGDDSNEDGSVDFVHADVGNNGIYEYSAYLKNKQWRKTNLVEAWLEMGFSLPWKRSAYKPHSLDIMFNGQPIGKLENTIPEGNYSFRIPPALMKFDSQGMPKDNQVGIKSKHLRGGHYVVNSDFRFKFRLTATPVWTIAENPKQARQRVDALSSVDILSVDVGISSASVKVKGPEKPKAGDAMQVVIPLRNMASRSPNRLAVGLYREMPDGTQKELARTVVRHLPLDGVHDVKLPFRAPGGENTLQVILDPDDDLQDVDKSNNVASFFLAAAGDNQPPVLHISYPSAGKKLRGGIQDLSFSVKDDQELLSVQVAVDGGLWQEQALDVSAHKVKLLLQPGQHELSVRATDTSGNIAHEDIKVEVEATQPPLVIESPSKGSTVNTRSLRVVASSKEPLLLVAARVNQGPWHKAVGVKQKWQLQLPLEFGQQQIEVMAVNHQGITTIKETQVQCTRQGIEKGGQEDKAVADQGVVWLGNNMDWQLDMFEQQSGILEKLSLSREQRAQRLLKDAEYRQARGDYAGAMNKYRESLLLKPDAKIEDRFKRLEFYLKIR